MSEKNFGVCLKGADPLICEKLVLFFQDKKIFKRRIFYFSVIIKKIIFLFSSFFPFFVFLF